MAGKFQPLSVIQGATFERSFNLVDADNTAINLAFFAGRCSVRNSAGTLIASPEVLIYDPLNGRCVMSMTAAITAALSVGVYSYDVEIYAGTLQVYKPLFGPFMVISEVTT